MDFDLIRNTLKQDNPCAAVWSPGDGTRYEFVLVPLYGLRRVVSDREYAFSGALPRDVFVSLSLGHSTYTFNLLDRWAGDPIHADYVAEKLGIENQATMGVATEFLNRVAGCEPVRFGCP